MRCVNATILASLKNNTLIFPTQLHTAYKVEPPEQITQSSLVRRVIIKWVYANRSFSEGKVCCALFALHGSEIIVCRFEQCTCVTLCITSPMFGDTIYKVELLLLFLTIGNYSV